MAGARRMDLGVEELGPISEPWSWAGFGIGAGAGFIVGAGFIGFAIAT